MSRPHHDLRVWRESMELAVDIYRLTQRFPPEERFGLSSQLRRAAVSVPSNVAEGAGRGGREEFRRFLRIARGSLAEIETQLRLASRFGYADTRQELARIETLFALIGGLIRSLRAVTDDSQAAKLPTYRS